MAELRKLLGESDDYMAPFREAEKRAGVQIRG
jgi:hypothetical protein